MSRIHFMAVLTAALVVCHAGAGDEPARNNGFPGEGREKGAGDASERSARKGRKERPEKLTPEERETKRKELRARLDKRLAELRKKETNASLSPAEQKELQRCEQLRKRFEQGRKTDKPRQPAATPS